MKRAVVFLLMLVMLASIVLPAAAAGSYTLPKPLKTVPGTAWGLSLPKELPPYVDIKSFSVDDAGAIHLELGEKVPRLKILEQNILDGVDSTIFTKKNASVADTHMVGKENSVFTVRMIWLLGNMEYIRDYNNWSGYMRFVSCTASEEADPAAFAPYTSAIRTISFNEFGVPFSETWTLENKKDRFTRVATYDTQGNLHSVKQTWESVQPGNYKFSTETDQNGNLTALTAEDKKNHFYAKSLQISENHEATMFLSAESLDPAAFDEIMALSYPQLSRGLIDNGFYLNPETDESFITIWDMNNENPMDLLPLPEPATMTDLEPATMTDLSPATMTDLPAEPIEDLTPIPADARVWTLNFGDFLNSQVYGFVTTDPIIVLRNGKATLNKKAKDVNGDAIKLKKNKITSPVLEIATIE